VTYGDVVTRVVSVVGVVGIVSVSRVVAVSVTISVVVVGGVPRVIFTSTEPLSMEISVISLNSSSANPILTSSIVYVPVLASNLVLNCISAKTPGLVGALFDRL